jgi:putative phage-type endonuclease
MPDLRSVALSSRESWLQHRRGGIGGSDSPVVMGASRWKSRYALWAEKTGLVDISTEETEFQKWGRIMEGPIAEEYERLTGRKVKRLGDYTVTQHAKIPFMICTFDGIVQADGWEGPLSIKTAAPWKAAEWDNAEAPIEYEVQLQHEMAVGGFDRGSFAILIWGKGVQWFDTVRNRNFVDALETECTDFWRRVLEGDAPAVDGSDTVTKAIRALYPTEDKGKVVELPDEALGWDQELARIAAEMKTLEERQQLLKNRIMDAMKDAEQGVLPGGGVWTWKEQQRSGYTVEPSSCRVLRRRKDGGKKR